MLPRADKPSRSELAKIHIAAKDLGLAEDDYRALLYSRYKVRSAADLSQRRAWDLLEHFRALGWRPRPTGSGPGPARPAPRPDDPQSRKILALWISLGQAGALRNASDMALNAYCKRMVGVDALRFATPAMKSRLIEHLKEWQRRTEGGA
jgi:phage gp16-like protein